MEGISVAGLQADSLPLEALSRMPRLRVLVMDGVQTDSMLSGFHLPRLAMLSWRNAGGLMLPVALEAIMSAAVLDISGGDVQRLPDNLEARLILLALHSLPVLDRPTFSARSRPVDKRVANMLAFIQ